MIGTLTAGGQLKLFFLNRAEHYMRENRTRLHKFLESIALLAESYIVVAVAMPFPHRDARHHVLGVWPGAQMSEGMLYGIVLGFIPLIHVAYAFLVWSSSKEQKCEGETVAKKKKIVVDLDLPKDDPTQRNFLIILFLSIMLGTRRVSFGSPTPASCPPPPANPCSPTLPVQP